MTPDGIEVASMSKHPHGVANIPSGEGLAMIPPLSDISLKQARSAKFNDLLLASMTQGSVVVNDHEIPATIARFQDERAPGINTEPKEGQINGALGELAAWWLGKDGSRWQ